MATAQSPLTVLLRAWQAGDHAAFAQLVKLVHAELQRMAASRLRGAETPSLAVGDLLNDALLKVMQAPPEWQNRGHFFATLSLAIRSVLVDHARAHQSGKRGGGLQRDDIAQVLGLSLATVDRELRFARAWLSAQLKREIEA